MSTRYSARILPMQTAGTHHFIERTYREGGAFQWIRELLVNALEAGATKVEFGIEWQAAESQGVLRRMVADDGKGMTADQLVEFFNTFGGGGKPIGGAHENFGVGSKTSLLPWNRYGMVVISWVGGDASMIWVARNPDTEEYGLRLEECDDAFGDAAIEGVYDPYDDPEHGCDWATIKPSWIKDHGTVVVLLGNKPSDNTVEGDQSRDEADIKGISSFLNRRMWDVSDDAEVYVDELRTTNRLHWPRSEDVAHGSVEKDGPDQRTNYRKIEGARHYIAYPVSRAKRGHLGAHGTVPLGDGTEIDWYLWEGERPNVHSYAAKTGYIAALYKRELYDVSAHHSTYRLFGITENSVRQLLWLIVRPVFDPEGKRGVYPRTDRSSLLLKGGPSAGGALPISDWAAEFAENMPDEILSVLRSARQGNPGTIEDVHWREKLAERFGARWKLARLRMRQGGAVLVQRAVNGLELLPRIRKSVRRKKPAVPDTPRAHALTRPVTKFAKLNGTVETENVETGIGLPHYRQVRSEDVGQGVLAAWQPNDPDYPQGVVLVNKEHPVLRSVIEHWQSQYADHQSDAIEKDVIDVYGQVAVSKIAHSESFRSVLPSDVIEKQMRSDYALTMSLLGLMAEDHLISTRIGGKYSKKRLAVRHPQKPR